MPYLYTTQKQVRLAFWNSRNYAGFEGHKVRQNAYNATIRSEWVDFVDYLARDNQISEALATRITL